VLFTAHRLQEEELHEKQLISEIPIIGVGRKQHLCENLKCKAVGIVLF